MVIGFPETNLLSHTTRNQALARKQQQDYVREKFNTRNNRPEDILLSSSRERTDRNTKMQNTVR